MTDDGTVSDEQLFFEFLYAEQFLSRLYNDCASHCSSDAVKAEMLNLLSESHQVCTDLYGEMSKRGWVATESADSDKVRAAKEKNADILSGF